jgi:two-component sensor histidine kinase
MLPMKNATGFDGTIAIAIDVRWLDYMVHAKKLPAGAVVAIFDAGGHVIAANRADVAAPVFAHANEQRKLGQDLYTANDRNGDTWLYSTAELLGSSVHVGFAMRESRLFGATYIHVGTDFLLPFLMIALSWVAIWFVTEYQITRWIVYLRRVSAAYRSGHYAFRPTLGGAPAEFRLLGDSMADMASAIQDRDRRLHDALDQKSILIREIHHRVKNNLQIVMSLLSLQAGRVRDTAAEDALKQARMRINALALVHRILHEIEDLMTVDLETLLTDLARQTREGFAGNRPGLHLTFDLVPRQISGNLAVPLALFTVEALTNVFKHAYPPPRETGTIAVSLKPADGGMLRLTVEDDGEGGLHAGSEANVGTKLIETFGEQVGGHAEMHARDGGGTVAELVFPDPGIHGSNGKMYGEH